MTGATTVEFRCGTEQEAVHIVELLRSRGLAQEDIRVISAEPLHRIGEMISGKSRLKYFVLSGALLGAVCGYALASVTSLLYPLNTGGMPIVSPLPFGIVTYEAMMLLAVLFTLAGVLIEARLPCRLSTEEAEHARQVLEGDILLLARVGQPSEADDLRMAVETGRTTSEL